MVDNYITMEQAQLLEFSGFTLFIITKHITNFEYKVLNREHAHSKPIFGDWFYNGFIMGDG